MEFSDYQRRASERDQVPVQGGEEPKYDSSAMLIPLLGLAGEVGELVSEYKKRLRDNQSYGLFSERIAEELGDLLWYLSNVATKFDLSLEEVASRNIRKIDARWASLQAKPFLDEGFPPSEQLPREVGVDFRIEAGKTIISVEGVQHGNALTDNRYEADGYRFHDVFHLANAAVLGWSPVFRALLKRKRKSVPEIDEVEDGARAIAIEEGITAIVFGYAEAHDYLDGAKGVTSELLRMIRQATAHLEVRSRTDGEWEHAIVQGFGVWRQVKAKQGGRVAVSLNDKTVRFTGNG